MTAKILASCLLAVATAAGQKAEEKKPEKEPEENGTVGLKGGLQAQMVSLGRSNNWQRPNLNAAIEVFETQFTA
jgi:hypothetical protein